MIDVGDGDGGRVAMDDFDFVSGCELAFFEHGKIKAAGIAGDEALDHVVAIETDGDFVAGHAWLRHLQEGAANSQLVTDMQRFFQQALGGEVFSESSPGEVGLRESLAPVGIVFGGIGVDGFVGTSVDGEVGLAVAIEVETLEIDGAFDGRLEDRGGDLSAFPEDDAGTADVYGEKLHADEIRRGRIEIRGIEL